MKIRPNQPPTVLVVDDEPVLRETASEILAEAGYRVREAPDADHALKLLESEPDIHLLFTDIQMPGFLSGVDLAREVHRRWPGILLLITSGGVCLSASDIPDDGHYMAKPYSPHKMLQEIETLLVSRRDFSRR